MAAFVPGLFVAGQRLADGCERLFDSCSVGLHVFEGAAGLVEFEFESGQVAAVQTLHLAADHVETGAQVFGSAAQQLGFRLAVLLFGANAQSRSTAGTVPSTAGLTGSKARALPRAAAYSP